MSRMADKTTFASAASGMGTDNFVLPLKQVTRACNLFSFDMKLIRPSSPYRATLTTTADNWHRGMACIYYNSLNLVREQDERQRDALCRGSVDLQPRCHVEIYAITLSEYDRHQRQRREPQRLQYNNTRQ